MNLLRYKWENMLALLVGLILSLVILEIFLRMYNPCSTRIRRGQIVLPKNQKYIFYYKQSDGTEQKVVHTKNSMGFRGEEIPVEFDKYLSIVTVGGSTTECFCLSDDKTWPYLLGEKLKKDYDCVWLNNAGLDGQSTFGHIRLLTDYIIKIKPKMIIFLVGLNDIARDDLNKYDKDPMCGYWSFWKRCMIKHSELASTIDIITRSAHAEKRHIRHEVMDLTRLPLFCDSELKNFVTLFTNTSSEQFSFAQIQDLYEISDV